MRLLSFIITTAVIQSHYSMVLPASLSHSLLLWVQQQLMFRCCQLGTTHNETQPLAVCCMQHGAVGLLVYAIFVRHADYSFQLSISSPRSSDGIVVVVSLISQQHARASQRRICQTSVQRGQDCSGCSVVWPPV